MIVDDCYQLGYIKKPHGLKGEVQVFLDTDEPSAYRKLESVFALRGQQLVPFFIESISVRGEKAIVAFEDVTSIDEAAGLKGTKLYLPLDFLPPLKGDELYLHDFEGFQVYDAQSKDLIGIVEGLVDAGPQLTLVIRHPSGKEVLLPLSKELEESIDKANKVLHLKVAEGLLDLYLSDED